MSMLKELLDAQLGRILLVASIAWFAAAVALNPVVRTDRSGEERIKDRENVTVPLDESTLATAAVESYFPREKTEAYEEGQIVWVPEKKKFEYKPVTLEVPVAGLMRPPMVLPSPGPSLQGSQALPRWGEEFPPILPPDPKTTPKTP
ncbi:MAG: hypothetical protein M5U26_14770 [Planctomycetota bacterium]|nr:hypothetical protein [Planctomycetota bacterium]